MACSIFAACCWSCAEVGSTVICCLRSESVLFSTSILVCTSIKACSTSLLTFPFSCARLMCVVPISGHLGGVSPAQVRERIDRTHKPGCHQFTCLLAAPCPHLELA